MTHNEMVEAEVDSLQAELSAALAALAVAREELQTAQANIDALISYPCAVAFDAARAGWSVGEAVGVVFEMSEEMMAYVDRVRAGAFEEAARLVDRHHETCDGDGTPGPCLKTVAQDIRRLDPLPPTLVILTRETRDEVRAALSAAWQGNADLKELRRLIALLDSVP